MQSLCFFLKHTQVAFRVSITSLMIIYARSRSCEPLVPGPVFLTQPAPPRGGDMAPQAPAGDSRPRLRLLAAAGGARIVLQVLPENLWARILGAGWLGQRVHVHATLLEVVTLPSAELGPLALPPAVRGRTCQPTAPAAESPHSDMSADLLNKRWCLHCFYFIIS